ncbi:MAG TPA: enoyl-CoA hydratase-related protein [Magnetospirillaceae bacterium]|jgi:2-(1,2-epoxy-1,2-dihydrophenyl)acetyl-CoA isomerase
MDYTAITFENTGAIARITLNRPDKLNCFTQTMILEIRHALDVVAAKDSGVRCLVITGAGRGFCSGQDLAEAMQMGGGHPDLGEVVEKSYTPMIKTLRELEMPVLGVINGIAAGAGAGFALACDIVIAARSASFLLPFAKIGLAADGGATWTLPRLIGHARALAMTMLGEAIPAEQAESWGMIWKVVDDAALPGEGKALAEKLASQPTLALALSKKLIQASTANTLDDQLAMEGRLQTIAGFSEDFQKGVAAFLQKRPAVFKGR